MEVKIGVQSFGRRLPHQHHQRHGKSIQVVVFLADNFEQHSQLRPLPIVKIAQALKMAPRVNLHLGREASKKWQQRDEAVIGCHHAPSVFYFALEDPAVQARALFARIGGGGIQLRRDQRRNERKRVDLAVRMRHGNSDRQASVLENRNVLDVGVLE